MGATTKEALKARLAELIASVENLPDDVFSDELARTKVQGQISGLKTAVDTPLESVFEICLQVGHYRLSITLEREAMEGSDFRSHRSHIRAPLLWLH